jgi:UDP-N-acetylmuramate: L-alanyl-gamma-D-glutamyl-meso-diaminopimelate ligase
LETIAENDTAIAFLDFAHSPSKLKATITAVKNRYPERKLVACIELHTYSSLTQDYLSQYADTMSRADVALVYYNPQVVLQKGLADLDPTKVQQAFGEGVMVFTDSDALQQQLQMQDYTNATLLLMTSGDFNGLDIPQIANKLINK